MGTSSDDAERVYRAAVRTLNDRFRVEGRGAGRLVVTAGVAARGDAFVRAAIEAVRGFDRFTTDNDPWGEHDFGALQVEGKQLFWKIDYYDPTLTYGSENPASEVATQRVLTIMLAEEY